MNTITRWRASTALLGAVLAGIGAPARAQEAGSSQWPIGVLEIARQGYFFVGQQYYTTPEGVEYLANQSYVEFQIPKVLKYRYPIVMFPGGGQTGTNFTGTP